MNILEKLGWIGAFLCIIGIAVIGGMFKGRSMCVNYADRVACSEERKCPEYTEFDLSYCPVCRPEYITESCEPDPMEVSYYEMQEQLEKALILIETQQSVIDVMNMLKGLE